MDFDKGRGTVIEKAQYDNWEGHTTVIRKVPYSTVRESKSIVIENILVSKVRLSTRAGFRMFGNR